MWRQGQSASSAATAPWTMLLSPYGDFVANGGPSYFTDEPAAMTLAAARNSRGHPVTACLHLAPPPALSRVRVRVRCCLPPAAIHRHRYRTTTVVSAHGGAVLLRFALAVCSRHPGVTEYFIYNAGAAGGGTGPPSLCLLPSPSSSIWKKRWPDLSSTGLVLRRGGTKAAVAQLSSATRRGLIERPASGASSVRGSSAVATIAKAAAVACGCRPRGAPRPPCPSPAACCAGSTCTAASSSPTCSTSAPCCGTCRIPRRRRRRRRPSSTCASRCVARSSWWTCRSLLSIPTPTPSAGGQSRRTPWHGLGKAWSAATPPASPGSGLPRRPSGLPRRRDHHERRQARGECCTCTNTGGGKRGEEEEEGTGGRWISHAAS
ncbi:hypothetical protein ACP4OV_014625 [Aristida adscensionis]